MNNSNLSEIQSSNQTNLDSSIILSKALKSRGGCQAEDVLLVYPQFCAQSDVPNLSKLQRNRVTSYTKIDIKETLGELEYHKFLTNQFG